MGVAHHKPMLRKPILMPPSMIEKVNKIAKNNTTSFAEVVRVAVDAFDPETSNEDMLVLEALADTMTSMAKTTMKHMAEIEKRLDETHELMEAQSGN